MFLYALNDSKLCFHILQISFWLEPDLHSVYIMIQKFLVKNLNPHFPLWYMFFLQYLKYTLQRQDHKVIYILSNILNFYYSHLDL